MSMIGEQVEELRKAAKWFDTACFPEGVKLANEAADTIESLSAKLQAVNMERSAKDCGGWIPCKDRLPTMEECQKNDCRFILDDGNRRYGGLFDYEKQCFTQFDFWRGLVEDKCAIAWQPLPNPYHEP